MREGGVNLHVYGSTFQYEARVFRVVVALGSIHLFDKIIMMGLRYNNILPSEQRFDDSSVIWRVNAIQDRSGWFSKVLSKLLFSWRVIRRLRGVKIKVVTCHSLSDLPTCCALKFLKRAKLVYDAHELETETVCSVGLRRVLARIVERVLIKYVDSTIVVSDSIFHWYKVKYSLKQLHIVRNIPDKVKVAHSDVVDLKKIFSIPREHILFIYQGVIDAERGVDRLLRLFSRASNDHHIVFLGFGGAVKRVKQFSSKHPNIHIHDAVSSKDLLRYTAGADVGIHLIPNNCINHDYCLPNKFFQYISMGLPVLVRNVKEMGGIVNHYNCGWVLSSGVETNDIDFINRISQKSVSFMKKGCVNCSEAFSWEKEKTVPVDVYKRLLL